MMIARNVYLVLLCISLIILKAFCLITITIPSTCAVKLLRVVRTNLHEWRQVFLLRTVPRGQAAYFSGYRSGYGVEKGNHILL